MVKILGKSTPRIKAPAANIKEAPVQNSPEIENLNAVIQRTKEAQLKYAAYTQKQVDEIFYRAAMAANQARISLAKMAVLETGMGVCEDKVIKNHFAAEFIYNKYRDAKTCGVIERDTVAGFSRIAEPVGILAGVVPTTNPTSTTIFKALLALKTRNAIIFSPHPRAKRSTVQAARIVLEAAVKAGAPEGIIGWVENPTIELSNHLMQHPLINLILATGGPGMVHAAYSSGKPAIGVGAGNTPALIDETADIEMAISSILISKTFDNGMICASEQSVVIVDKVYAIAKEEFTKRGAYILNENQRRKLAALLLIEGKLNAEIVGQSATKIAHMAGFEVPEETKVLIAEVKTVGRDEPLSYEKLSPILAMYRAEDFHQAVGIAVDLITFGGMGHTSVLYTNPKNADRIQEFGARLKTGRVLLNMPSSQGAIGDLYNFRLEPSLTLGCGSWGGNSVSENISVRHLLNIKTIAERRENMLWFRVPPKIFFKFGCLPVALRELEGCKRVFLVTDHQLAKMGFIKKMTDILDSMNIDCEVFYEVNPDPDLATIKKGLAMMNAFHPDAVIALGGGSPIDAAKIMRLLYDYPEVQFKDLAMRFMDIYKRICKVPGTGTKTLMVAIPTTSGTGSEVTPFAVITDEKENVKYPIADYELTPDIAIIDPELVLGMPKGLTAASGIDAVTHALEAMVAVTSTEFTNGQAIEALRLLFKYLPQAYEDGGNIKAREKVHYAATMAGMAFANAFLGVCHSMAHKLGGTFHIPHGVANGILITHVIRYNADESPSKQTAFAQYTHPLAQARYARVADYLGLGGIDEKDKVERLIKAVEDLRRKLKIPATIAEAGVKKADFMAKLDELCEQAFDDQCTGCNPRLPLIKEIRAILLTSYGT
jgi:acetaldehyde dehydrogenase/alcohol dehydrogenase